MKPQKKKILIGGDRLITNDFLDDELSKKLYEVQKLKILYDEKTEELRKLFLHKTDEPTICSLIDIVNRVGHPSEKKEINIFKKGYYNGTLDCVQISIINDTYLNYRDKLEELLLNNKED